MTKRAWHWTLLIYALAFWAGLIWVTKEAVAHDCIFCAPQSESRTREYYQAQEHRRQQRAFEAEQREWERRRRDDYEAQQTRDNAREWRLRYMK